MKKYGVRLYFDTYLYQEVEAESEEDAAKQIQQEHWDIHSIDLVE